MTNEQKACELSALQMYEWTISKACEWLKSEIAKSLKGNIADYQWLFDKYLDDFKTAMEE